MLIMTQGDALTSGVGPADDNIFSAEIVGAGDAESASGFMKN